MSKPKVFDASRCRCALRRVFRQRARYAGEARGGRRQLLQGGIRRAAWLRGIGHRQNPGANPRRRDQRQADAEGRLDPRDDKGKYAAEYEYHGSKFSEGVKEVSWSGGKLADDNYDEFVLATFLTGGLKPNTTLYFPVVQECEKGVSRWIDIPKAGAGSHSHDGKSPAPGLKLISKP